VTNSLEKLAKHFDTRKQCKNCTKAESASRLIQNAMENAKYSMQPKN